jgi:hypothetical protein
MNILVARQSLDPVVALPNVQKNGGMGRDKLLFAGLTGGYN